MCSRRELIAAGIAVAIGSVWRSRAAGAAVATGPFAVTHTDAEWRKLLSPAAYDVLRHEGTERAGTSALLHETRRGTFVCAGCNLDLFSSTTKFDSHTGWPSFWAPLDNAIGEVRDSTFGMVRTAVHCRQCGGHQGHVFDDGPKPTGLRYCINGVALTFHPSGA